MGRGGGFVFLCWPPVALSFSSAFDFVVCVSWDGVGEAQIANNTKVQFKSLTTPD